jgi:cytoskeletal protein CcmA (bactofilin family)
MFSKTKPTTKPATLGLAAAPAPAAPTSVEPASKRAPRVASLIAPDITFEGGVIGDGELQVDGVVRGDIKVARLSVGETGHIEGSVVAEAVECRGRIVGSITAKQVRLYGASHVDGDITHEQLAMETGAFFQGRSLKFQRQAQVAQPAPAAAAAPAQLQAPVAQQ